MSTQTVVSYPIGNASISSLDKLLNQLLGVSQNVQSINQKGTQINVTFAPGYAPTAALNTSIQNIINSFTDTPAKKSIAIESSLAGTDLTITSTTSSTSTTTGSIVSAGGLGIAENVNVGGDLTVNKNVSVPTGYITVPTSPTAGNQVTNKTYVDSVIVLPGTGLNKTGVTLNMNATQPTLTSIGTAGTQLTVPSYVLIGDLTDSAASTNGALVVNGGLGVGGNVNIGKGLTVAGANVNVSGYKIVNVQDPTVASDAATKNYVDSVAQGLSTKDSVIVASTMNVSLATLATGSSMDGTALVTGNRVLLKNQTNAVENGIYIITATAPPRRSTDMANGSDASGSYTFVERGATNATSGWVVNNTDSAIVGTDALTFSQFSAAGQIITGPGIGKNGNTLFAVPDGTSLEISGASFRLSSGAIGTGLSGGSGVPISVNSTLPFVTSVGTLTVGTWNASTIAVAYGGTGATSFATNNILFGNGTGAIGTSTNFTFNAGLLTTPSITITSTATSTSTTTGALTVVGGLGVQGSLFLGTNLSVSGTTNLVGTVTVPTPINLTDAVNKSYTDGASYLSAGTGLTKTGSTFSVNPAQTQITSVGTLTGLTSSGAVVITDTTVSSSSTTGALVVSGGIGAAGSINIGTNLSVTGTASVTGAATVGSLSTSGTLNVTNVTASTNSTTGSVVVAGGFGLAGSMNIGTNLAVTGTTTLAGIATVTNTTISTSTTTGALQVRGGFGLTGNQYIGGALNVAGATTVAALTASGLTRVTNATVSTSTTTGALVVTGGFGLGGSVFVGGNSNITGTQTVAGVFTVTNATVSTSATTGAFLVTGGVGIQGSQFLGGNLSVTGTSTFTSTVTVPSPVNATDATTKAYVDGLAYVTAGTGLTKTGATLAVNASQTQITTVGTLTGLTSSGAVSITNTTQSTSVATGALTVTGGVGISGNQYVGGTLAVVNTTQSTSTTTGSLIVSGGVGITGNQFIGGSLNLAGPTYYPNNLIISTGTNATNTANGYRLRNQDSTNVNTVFSLANNVATTNIISRIVLMSLGNEASANAESMYVDSSINGGAIYWGTAGTGTSRSLTVWGSTVFNVAGTITQNSTFDAVSTTTGSISVAGGLSAAKSVYVGTNLYVGSPNVLLNFGTGTGFNSLRLRNNDATNTETHFSIANGGAAAGYASRFRAYALGSSDVANLEFLEMSATTTGGNISWVNAGTGVARSIGISGTAFVIAAGGTSASFGTGTPVSITNNTASTSTTTGALTIGGGFGAVGNAFIGGTLSVTGASTFSATVTVPTPVNTTDATTKAYVDGLTFITAGTGLTKTGATLSVNASQTQITSVGTLTSLNSSGLVRFTNATASTSTTTGALVVTGGVGIGGNGNIGGTLTVTGATTLAALTSSGVVTLNNATASTSTTTGALVLAGGVGIGGNGNIGGTLTVTGATTLTSLTASGVITLTNATQSTSTTTGSLILLGGLGLTGNMYSGGLLNVAGSGTFGSTITQNASTITDATTAASGTLAQSSYATFNAPTLAATNTAVTTTNAATVYISGPPVAGTNETITNSYALQVASGTSLIGNMTFGPFQTTAGWINLPTSGPSGIGTGGAGANALVALATTAGHWFTNSVPGDVCYRNANGRILYGNTSGNYGLALSGDVLQSMNTTDSTSATTGGATFAGGIGVAKSISTGAGIRLMGSTSGNVLMNAPATVTPYTMTTPAALPTTNSYVTMTTTGALGYQAMSASTVAYDGGTTLRTNIVIYTDIVTTANGTATCYCTTNGLSTGTSVFKTAILYAAATPILNTTAATSVPWASVRTQTLTSVVFQVITGVSGSGANGGTAVTTQYAANGISVMVYIIGY